MCYNVAKSIQIIVPFFPIGKCMQNFSYVACIQNPSPTESKITIGNLKLFLMKLFQITNCNGSAGRYVWSYQLQVTTIMPYNRCLSISGQILLSISGQILFCSLYGILYTFKVIGNHGVTELHTKLRLQIASLTRLAT